MGFEPFHEHIHKPIMSNIICGLKALGNLCFEVKVKTEIDLNLVRCIHIVGKKFKVKFKH